MASVALDPTVGSNATGENNLNPLSSFFGPTNGHHEKLRADDQLSHETYNLPDAYKGKNKYLETVLDFMIRKEDEFYTSTLLPWEYTDDLHVSWDIFSFNRTLADLEPSQGLPRFVTQESEAHSDNLLRRGLAFIIEHGFYKTERGKRHFALNLQQITDAVHTTCYFGVIHALLGGKSYYKEWTRKFGRQVARKNDLFQEERKRWAIVQKSKDGLYLLDAELRHELKREGVVPNLYVFPDKMGIYVNMVSGNALDYDKRGPEAVVNRNSGDRVSTFRGLPVFEAQSFDVEFTSEPVDLLIRERQCGEWFYRAKSDSKLAIYSADADKFVKLPDIEAKHEFGQRTAGANNTNGVTAITGGSNTGFILFRPWQTYRMASCILAKGGSELGNTYHGHHDFMLSDDILRKVHVGHYTFYSKSVVKRPKNYIVVEDVFAQGYVGGEGTEFFHNDKSGSGQEDSKKLSTHMSNNTLGRGGSPSIVCVATGDCPQDNVVDITGRFHQTVYDLYSDETALEHYEGSGTAYDDMKLSLIETYRQQSSDEYVQRVQRFNTVCFRGMEMTSVNGKMEITQLNTGHWGENVYQGCRKVRDGENSFLKDMNYVAVTSL